MSGVGREAEFDVYRCRAGLLRCAFSSVLLRSARELREKRRPAITQFEGELNAVARFCEHARTRPALATTCSRRDRHDGDFESAICLDLVPEAASDLARRIAAGPAGHLLDPHRV